MLKLCRGRSGTNATNRSGASCRRRGESPQVKRIGIMLALPWYVASMMPIRFTWGDSPRRRQLAPDLFVAFVPDRPRQSFNIHVEGGLPPFVLEVTSPSSIARDREIKRVAYDELGAREYAIFTPRLDAPSTLEGYRRTLNGTFEPWPTDAEGRLWS